MTDAMEALIERLEAIAEHDWRLSFLAHTSDTAKEAATALRSLASPVPKDDAVERATRAVQAELKRQLADPVSIAGHGYLNAKAITIAALTAAGPGRVVEGQQTLRDHLLSMTDGSNWPEMKGERFKGYNDAMETVHQFVMEWWDELSATPPPPVPAAQRSLNVPPGPPDRWDDVSGDCD